MTTIADIGTAMTTLKGYCVTAGAALSAPITDVAIGTPKPVGRCIRLWYGGEDVPTPMGQNNRVLSGEMIGEVIHITAFFPAQGASGSTVDAAIDADLRTLKDKLRTLILGNSTLGGTVTDLELPYQSANVWETIDGTVTRTLETMVVLAFTEYVTNP